MEEPSGEISERGIPYSLFSVENEFKEVMDKFGGSALQSKISHSTSSATKKYSLST